MSAETVGTVTEAARTPLQGAERFRGLDASVVDFWRFAMSDLQVNTVRGLFAEFLVQQAVGGAGAREEWASYDVQADDGTTIEVKSSSALQSWEHARPSRITFSGLRSRVWTETGHAATATYNAQVYVFAVHAVTERAAYDPLDVDQWQFYALARDAVEAYGCASLALRTVQRLAGPPLAFHELADAVRRCAAAPTA